jgi:hypothetical protein
MGKRVRETVLGVATEAIKVSVAAGERPETTKPLPLLPVV